MNHSVGISIRFLGTIFAFFAIYCVLDATKLVEVRPLDSTHLMVYFKDGEVIYKDDGTGPSAYKGGHETAEGDDQLVAYGDELNVEAVSKLENWTLVAKDKGAQGGSAMHPIEVFRKSKVNSTDLQWDYKLDHWIFLKFSEPFHQGSDYLLQIDPQTNCDQPEVPFTYDVFTSCSEAIHVNLLGYTVKSPVKSADLYLWLGDGGPRDYSSFEGKKVWIKNQANGKLSEVGQVVFWKGNEPEALERSLTGSPVWNVDFTDFQEIGRYRLVVEDVGCSPEFEIRDDIYFEPYKTSLRGYYYMRVGEDRMDLTPVPRRPTFIPNEDPVGFTIYITDFDPFDAEWIARRGDTWDEPHWLPAKESMFWKRRVPGNPTNPNARGGHSDAADWDRHLAHISNIYDILLPYILSDGRIAEDNLQIGESGNGLPDVIDEARNEVDFFLSIRDGEGYSQGLTNPTTEGTFMFQAGTTTMAAWANAANAAMLAESLRIAGESELSNHYQNEAIIAYRFAEKQNNQQLDDLQEIGNGVMRGRDFKMMAAAFLYNVTGDSSWEDELVRESVIKSPETSVEVKDKWCQLWGTVAYLFSPQERHYPELYENMKASIRRRAEIHNLKWMDLRPSRRTSNNNYWQTAQNLHCVMISHALSEDEVEKQRLLRAMILEADWGLGRNPGNIVEMTGLGSRSIMNCFTSGWNDGTPGVHPGHTPYNNMDPWGKNNGSNPHWFAERGYPKWIEGWPHQEAHFNCRYTWTNSEFTPRETMRGKMALYGYLYAIRNLSPTE